MPRHGHSADTPSRARARERAPACEQLHARLGHPLKKWKPIAVGSVVVVVSRGAFQYRPYDIFHAIKVQQFSNSWAHLGPPPEDIKAPTVRVIIIVRVVTGEAGQGRGVHLQRALFGGRRGEGGRGL